RYSEAAFMTFGIAAMGLGVLSLACTSYIAVEQVITQPMVLLWMQLGGLTFAVVGFAFLTPSAQALISRRAYPARPGEILGVNQSISALARILGPVMGVSLYLQSATRMLPYIVGAGLLLAMLPLMPWVSAGEPCPPGADDTVPPGLPPAEAGSS